LEIVVRSGDQVVRLVPHPVRLPEANLWEPLPYAGCEHGGFQVDVPFAALTGTDLWHLHGVLRSQGISSAGGFHYRIPGSSADHPGSAHDVQAFWDSSDGFALRRQPRTKIHARRGTNRSRLTVHGLEVLEDQVLVRASGAPWEALSRAVIAGPQARLGLVDLEAQGSHVLLRFDTRASQFGGPRRAAPAGIYELNLDGEPATPARDLLAELPLRVTGPRLTVEVKVTREHVLQLVFGPPLLEDELGLYHQFRLQASYQRDASPVGEAIVFASDQGASCTDNQLAMDRRLAVTHPEVQRIWAVRDRSVVVPEGARSVLLHSAEWYEAVATSRWICSNMNLGPWLRLRQGQAYLQTFSGHPSGAMGRALWRRKGFPPGRVRHLARSACAEWDLLLVPSEEAAGCYREQYGYTGPMLIAGYPRTDSLVSGTAARVRQEVLPRLGAPQDQTVVLYAPSDRDALTTDSRTGRRYAGVDLNQLSRDLGHGYTILVRDPPDRNARRNLPDTVIDVTHYPEVNDLVIAADVAVLDYSPLRFDWALTGKPMVFFVPDLESYLAARPPVLPFADTAPGPWARTTAELADHLRRPGQIADAYAEERTWFNERFNTLNDGRATEQVLASFLDPEMPWRTK